MEIKGKMNTAIAYARVIEDEAIEQIRRMCEAVGLTVTRLVRLRIMHINLGNLKAGEYRLLTKKETRDLMELLRDSTNETLAPPPRTRT